ncbi:MaoC family dehydratase N-terminal domain-containing protein [Rhodococcus koreensis]|uniref:FAS1-like dehydratase domain-containing protein n=1 Tax=Rhodococcus koreensis TaxID=99653 RepID=UPI00366FD17A
MRGDQVVGLQLPRFDVTVERSQMVEFATSIGEERRQFFDPEVAWAFGHPDILLPPTYLFALEFRRPQPYLAVELLGASLSSVLHAEQSFQYHTPCHAGEKLEFDPRIDDYFEKSQGRLGFLRRRTTVSRNGDRVAVLENLLAIRWDVNT